MDREHYVSGAERQLNDSTFYKALDHDPTHEFARKVADAISEMRNGDHISEKNAVYLTVDQPRSRTVLPPTQDSQSWKPWTSHSVCQWTPNRKNIRIC